MAPLLLYLLATSRKALTVTANKLAFDRYMQHTDRQIRHWGNRSSTPWPGVTWRFRKKGRKH